MIDIVKFKAKDGIILDGILRKQEEKTDRILIQIHGMVSNCFKKREKVIAEKVGGIGIDTLCFNNRGSEIIRYIKTEEESFLGGTAYEDVEDGYYDIVGAMEFALSLGYKEIYLQGHSLGSTKVVFTYNKLKEENNSILANIKGIILLSLVDIPGTIDFDTNERFLKLAEEMESNGKQEELMPLESFTHPISVKTLLRYAKYYQNIDFAKYGCKDDEFKVLNKITVPLFMRWGNVNEIIKQDAKELSEFMNEKIKNSNKNIGYIDGADHSYWDKEDQLAEEIFKWIVNC